MTLEQLMNFLVDFRMSHPRSVLDKMRIFFDCTEGSLSAKYENDEKIISIKVLKDAFRVEQTIKEKQTYQN